MDSLSKFLPTNEPRAAQQPPPPTNTPENQVITFLTQALDDMRGQINEAFTVVDARLRALEAAPKNESIPLRFTLALQALSNGLLTQKRGEEIVAEFLGDGKQAAADEPSSGTPAADDDGDGQAYLQAQVLRDEFDRTGESTPVESGDNRPTG